MAHDDNDPGHGNSIAAWVGVIIMLVGFTVGTVAFFFAIVPVVLVGVVIVILGPIAGKIVSAAGYGVGGARVAKSHD